MDLKGRLYFRWIGGLAARLSRLLVTDSEDAKQKITQALDVPDHKVRVVHLGVDATFRRIVDPDLLDTVRARYRLPERFILVVGTREPRKNLPILVQAYRRMRRANQTKLGLVIAGRAGWRPGPMRPGTAPQTGVDKPWPRPGIQRVRAADAPTEFLGEQANRKLRFFLP